MVVRVSSTEYLGWGDVCNVSRSRYGEEEEEILEVIARTALGVIDLDQKKPFSVKQIWKIAAHCSLHERPFHSATFVSTDSHTYKYITDPDKREVDESGGLLLEDLKTLAFALSNGVHDELYYRPVVTVLYCELVQLWSVLSYNPPD